jgi:outer membrane immunogenic protein
MIGPPVLAADMPVKAPPPPPVPVWSWTGCYVGGNVGAGWTRQDQNRIDILGPTIAPVVAGPAPAAYGVESDNSLIGGGQVGCDYQFSQQWVVGIQGQFDWGSMTGSHVLPAFPTFTMYDRTRNFDTLTARLGYAFKPGLLAYVKGGAAWTRDSDTLLQPSGALSESAVWTASGWTVGGGLEYRIVGNWSVFAEYDYLGFGTKTLTFVAPPGLSSAGEQVAIAQDVQEFKLGVNYRFNWTAPSAPMLTK